MSINATAYKDDSKVMSEKYIIYISLILLMISCSGNGITESIAKIFWLISLLMIGRVNFGAAFGIYLASVTIYNAKHVWMQESILERMEHLLEFPLPVLKGRLPWYLDARLAALGVHVRKAAVPGMPFVIEDRDS